MADTYWAALSGKELGDAAMARIDEYFRYAASSGELARMADTDALYYGGGPDGRSYELLTAGKQDELVRLRVNHVANLGQHLLNLAASEPPAWAPVAMNSDLKSGAQTRLAAGVLDYYFRTKRFERVRRDANELAIMHGTSYVVVDWDTSAGTQHGVAPDGRPYNQGDVRAEVYSPIDVAVDPREDCRKHKWHLVRDWVNRYDLAAQYGRQDETGAWDEVGQKILSLPSEETSTYERRIRRWDATASESDLIPRWTLFHAPSPALPRGKIAHILAADLVFSEGPLPYSSSPVLTHMPRAKKGSMHGHSPLWDLLAIQRTVDLLYSAVATNQLSFGVQNVLVAAGSNLNVEALLGGLNMIEFAGPTPPTPLNLTNTPQEIFGFIQQLEKAMETLSGVNSVMRGNPEGQLKGSSGAALALLHSQSLQFASGLVASDIALQEDMGTAIISILQSFASTPRIAEIAGKNKQWMLREFTGQDLSAIRRVTVEVAPPVSKSIAGRLQIADSLAQQGLIDGQEFLQVLRTGLLEPALEKEDTEAMLIRSENERLASGEPVVVVPTDNDARHAKAHRSVLDNLDSRDRPEVVQAVRAHIDEHYQAATTKDPLLQAFMGHVPPPPPEAAGQGRPADVVGAPAEQLPAQPNFPENPATGEEWSPETGGLE